MTPGVLTPKRIIRKYARRNPRGGLIRCTPSQKELRGGTPRLMTEGSDYKYIYDSREIAKNCAAELEKHFGYPLREYPCQRSRKGHFHLTTDHSVLREKANP